LFKGDATLLEDVRTGGVGEEAGGRRERSECDPLRM